jgi:hypothetical protein
MTNNRVIFHLTKEEIGIMENAISSICIHLHFHIHFFHSFIYDALSAQVWKKEFSIFTFFMENS